MVFATVTFFLSFLVDILRMKPKNIHDKDLEIALLRQQLRIVARGQTRGPSIPRWQKLTLAILASRLKNVREALHADALLFKPATLLRWHRELVRWKWTFKTQRKPGRPKIDPELESLIVKLVKENPSFGHGKLQGELKKLGYKVCKNTIKNVMKRRDLPPAPERSNKGLSWQRFLSHYQDQILACDFFTVETAWLNTIYVLFFIELKTRRIYFVGCTTHPGSAWVTQQARQLLWSLEDREPSIKYLIHDRDTKFSPSFDIVFASERIEHILTPYQAPNANAFAERWVRSVREECLDHLLILNETHLRQVLEEYVNYFNTRRPHQGIDQEAPAGLDPPDIDQPIRCRKVLGGIIHDYYRAAA